MKKQTLFWLTIICYSFALQAQTKIAFGVKPGLKMNSAWIGIQQEKVLPYIGVDFLWLSADGTYEKTEENYESLETYQREQISINYSGKGLLVIPHVGFKYFFSKKVLKPYFFTGLFFGLPMVELQADGTQKNWRYENNQLVESSTKNAVRSMAEIEKSVQEALGFWGISFGGGAEYYFSENFSVGGEYGFRLVFDSATHDYQSDNIDPDLLTGYRKHWQIEAAGSLKLSYAVVTANFYF